MFYDVTDARNEVELSAHGITWIWGSAPVTPFFVASSFVPRTLYRCCCRNHCSEASSACLHAPAAVPAHASDQFQSKRAAGGTAMVFKALAGIFRNVKRPWEVSWWEL